MWHDLMQRLEGRLVALEPIREEHREPLRAAGADPVIWAWMQIDGSEPEGFDRWFAHALREAEAEREAPFVTIRREGGAVLGSTRYMTLRPEHRGVEIGNTWLARSAWSSGANVEAKLLMLEHAFETLGCVRVEFKTDSRNERSRAALAAIPAQFEGVLRNHMIVPDVGQRDSAYYSVIETEWPDVRENLRRRLERGRREA
jgi:N-acetyltransferase